MSMEIAVKREDSPQVPVAFRLLGAFQLTVGGRPEWLGPEQAQRLLVKLLAARCVPVGNEELMRAIWDEVPGPGATTQALHHLVCVARRHLAAAGLRDVLVNGRGTYLLDVPPALVDVHMLHALTARARELSRDGGKGAVALLEQAVSLRAGEPLAGLRGAWIERYRHTLAEELDTAEQSFYETAIMHGEAHDRLPGLSALHRDRPGDERLTWLYMHALYRTGQQAEALAVKQESDRYLRDEYGMDCGKALNDLYQRILNKDDTLLTPGAVRFPAGEAGAQARPPGHPDPQASQREPDAGQHQATGQRQETGTPTVSNVFNGPVDVRYGVIGPQTIHGSQIIHGAPR
jgi:SARP family transcriptional regulator, regulator of embCAB operon